MQYRPCGLVAAKLKLTFEPLRRHPRRFSMGHMPSRREPCLQWQAGPLKDRPRCQAHSTLTPSASPIPLRSLPAR